VSADKDQRGILAALAPLASRLILTPYGSPRSATPADLARHVPTESVTPELATSPHEALAMALTGSRTPIICVAGSLFLIGEVLAQLREKQQDFLVAYGPADSMKAHGRARSLPPP
jgi:folylpolyglutamate synthase/dihydropteroate synthase